MTEMTGGELLLRALHAEDIQHIHAITDGTYMIFLEALERLGNEFGMTHHRAASRGRRCPCCRRVRSRHRQAGHRHGLRRSGSGQFAFRRHLCAG